MIDLSALQNNAFFIVGLGTSGLATAEALRAAGAKIHVWDDHHIPDDLTPFSLNPKAANLGDFDALVLSPGIPLSHSSAVKAKAANIDIIGDVELAFRAGLKAKAIGITGTNGKSTTTALIHHTLKAMGQRAEIGGNFGPPTLAMTDPGPDGFVVLELSSYQLELSDGYPLAAACLLNISPDHLERHGDLAHYAAAKARIFRQSDFSLVTGEDAQSLAIANAVSAQILGPQDWATFPETPALRGAHNQQNQAATCHLLMALGFAEADIRAAMATFPGAPHRQEILGTANGWTFVNDSKATNVDSAVRALAAFDNIHWLAGGRGKAGGVEGLTPGLKNVTHAYLYGENHAELAALCRAKDTPFAEFDTLDQAVHQALTAKGGTMLLAPAAASWDQYPSFEARGDAFRALVHPYLREAA